VPAWGVAFTQADYLTVSEVLHLLSPFDAGGQHARLEKPEMTAWEKIYVVVV